MEFKAMKKVYGGKFIDRYDIEYETNDGNVKVYEMISRDHNMSSFDDLRKAKNEAVILIMTDEAGERILLNHEFRMATGEWVYNFPAGLIDPGETPEEAAARELREETGLRLVSMDTVLGPSFSAIGFSNERTLTMIGTAAGEFHESSSAEEEIEPGWYTKAEVRDLIRNNELFAARTQAFCYPWSKE